MPYEVEYRFAGWAADCVDWLRAHPVYLLEIKLEWNNELALRQPYS